MNRFRLSVAMGALLATGLPALAQKTPDVAEVTVWKLKAGTTTAAFAEARKKHNEFHRAQKDSFTLHVWEVTNGDQMGQFVVVSPGHYWKEFDGREAFAALDIADSARTLDLHAETVSSGFWIRMADQSRATPGATAPSKYAQVTHYWISPAAAPAFEDDVKAVTEALNKVNWPAYSSWYRLASGGDGPHYVLVTDRHSMAEFAPPEKSLVDTVGAELGVRRAGEIFDSIRSATKKVYTEVLQFRADLSYSPLSK